MVKKSEEEIEAELSPTTMESKESEKGEAEEEKKEPEAEEEEKEEPKAEETTKEEEPKAEEEKEEQPPEEEKKEEPEKEEEKPEEKEPEPTEEEKPPEEPEAEEKPPVEEPPVEEKPPEEEPMPYIGEKPEEEKPEEEKPEEKPPEEEKPPLEEKPSEEPKPEEEKPPEEPEPKGEKPEEPPADTSMHLFAIRTTVGKESTVVDFIVNRVKREKAEIPAIIAPASLKGYVLVESLDKEEISKVVQGVQHVRGIIEGEVDYGEVTHYLEAKVVKEVPEKALVELTSGPFKGEKAKVIRVDKSKDTVTVELIEATVPIPITIKMDSVRVLAEDASVLEAEEIKDQSED